MTIEERRNERGKAKKKKGKQIRNFFLSIFEVVKCTHLFIHPKIIEAINQYLVNAIRFMNCINRGQQSKFYFFPQSAFFHLCLP